MIDDRPIISRSDRTMVGSPADNAERPEDLYLTLLKRSLTGSLHGDLLSQVGLVGSTPLQRVLYAPIRALQRHFAFAVVRRVDPTIRAEGRDWPLQGETMIGMRRLDHLEECIVDVLRRGVPGDLIEAGVWRGGATIFMRGVLKAYDDRRRRVWVADSFQGLPHPDSTCYPVDASDQHYDAKPLAVSVDQVKANFARYGLLDDQVRFLVGWFKDTLPQASIDQLAILRLDGDMYQSTMDGLRHLYPRLSVGGYAIVDDYLNLPPCRQAVDTFRREQGIREPLLPIDWTGVFWQRQE